MENQNDLLAALEYVRAGNLTYDEWTAVGMGLKEAGLPCSVWDDWSALDSQRYHKGECARKWETFRGASGAPITENSIFKWPMTAAGPARLGMN
ncbi:MAG: PriCT-2 domain-containing protein [Ruthenibacterium lactatiformans]